MSTIKINFSHNIKAASISLAYFHDYVVKGGPEVQVHATGCAHEKKAYMVRPLAETGPEFQAGILADDYFHVAPCARKA